ncbi:sugar transferase [Poriferisphaera sp. WC338]|uniref:sugar transferase n=1 Tax=Poriferisphaera sp. WC338 TaxID=3425129 RepID=UPI003D81AF58
MPTDSNTQQHTIWGLSPQELHDRFWAARGAQVIRLGSNTPINNNAELYLLTDETSMVIFRMGQLLDTLNWLKPHLLLLRIHDTRDHGYQERVITDDDNHFLRFERVYGQYHIRLGRVGITPDANIAARWQQLANDNTAWRQLRRELPQNDRATASIEGVVYDRTYESEVQQFMREIINIWRRPDVTVKNLNRLEHDVWGDPAITSSNTKFVGPVWVGAGRQLKAIDSIVGPAVLWDRPEHRPQADELLWDQIENPIDAKEFQFDIKPRKLSSLQKFMKRAFDFTFASIVLLCLIPVFPIVMLAIWIEDGRPFFFAHRRETMGGKEFPCIKFRSMRNDAEEIKKKLQEDNVSDGPHFFIEKDPRHTAVGRFIRKYNIDELPQFINVFLGHMSIVGPRPSPYNENQYCPPWREARLSVRPGITGMWQVYRSRDEGLDFQEWIKYDLEYVENMSFMLDMKLIALTIKQLAGG